MKATRFAAGNRNHGLVLILFRFDIYRVTVLEDPTHKPDLHTRPVDIWATRLKSHYEQGFQTGTKESPSTP